MRRLVVGLIASLDGVMQAPGGPEEDPTGGFRFGGWTFPFWDEIGDAAMGEAFAKPFDLLLGRKTYEIFAALWPYQQDEIAGIRSTPPPNMSPPPRPSRWPGRTASGWRATCRRAVARLKQGDGPDLLTQGSATLVHSLLAAGLVDELILLVFPVLLGRGKSWFGEDARPARVDAGARPAPPRPA